MALQSVDNIFIILRITLEPNRDGGSCDTFTTPGGIEVKDQKTKPSQNMY